MSKKVAYQRKFTGLILLAAAVFIFQGCGSRSDDNSKRDGGSNSDSGQVGGSSAGTVSKLKSESEFSSLLKQHPVVLVDFYADWCGPCRKLKPTIAGLAEQYKDDVKVIALDVDKFGNLARNFQITSIPTIKIFKSGSVQKTLVGVYPASEYSRALEKALAN